MVDIFLSHIDLLLSTAHRAIKSRRLGWAIQAACVVEMRNSYKILAGNPEGKKQRGRAGRSWKANI
jgi:hypothetical protein